MTTIRYADAVQEQLPATDTTVYTAPTNVKSAHIIFGNCTCEDATGDTLTVNLVQSGATAAVTNQYLSAKAIATGVSDSLSEIIGAVLMPGDFISAKAATADRLNLKFGIKEIY